MVDLITHILVYLKAKLDCVQIKKLITEVYAVEESFELLNYSSNFCLMT